MRRIACGLLVTLAAGGASAGDLESMKLVDNLGNVIASEAFCGLTYDQAAIAAFVEANVPADDMGFSGSLNSQVITVKYLNEQMSASGKTAHCTQIARVAKAYGFTK